MSGQKTNTKNLILAIIVLGSICGLVEVVISGLLKQVDFVYRSALLVGLGFMVIGFGLAIFKKPAMAFFLALITIMSKNLAVVMLHLPALCMANSSLAVLLEYGALGGIAAFSMGGLAKSTKARIAVGGGAAASSAIAFYFVGMHVAPCNYLLSFNTSAGFFSYLIAEALPWTIAAVVLFPLGWLVGEKLADRTLAMLEARPSLYYVGSVVTTAVCWALCAVAISNGL
jgi:hypothetical protein